MAERAKPIIAVDIDDVISTNARDFIKYSNEKFGTNLTIDDYHEHWIDVWKVDFEKGKQWAEEYHNSGRFSDYGLISDAKEVLEKLKDKYKLIILTSRRTSINKITHDWIDKNFPNIFEDIIFTGFFDKVDGESITKTKAQLAKEIFADYLIDDQPKHILSASEIGIKGLLFGEYSWNKIDSIPENVIKVKDWKEISEYFEKISNE